MPDKKIIKIEKLVYEGKGMGLPSPQSGREGEAPWALPTEGATRAPLKPKPVFVPYVAAGETVEVEITRHHRQYSEAKLIAVLEPAPERIEPPCPYYGECGGCQWQHIRYESQLEWKQKILAEILRRVGKIENPKVLATIPSPKTLGWRSRFTFHGNDRGQIGFYKPNSYAVVDIEKCLIADDAVNEQLAGLRKEKITKRDYELNVSGKKGFTQVNPLQNENLKSLLKAWAENIPHETIVELFCGSGNLTEALIPLAKKIVAVDSDRTAIDLATQLLHSYTSTLLHLKCTDSVKFFAQYKPEVPLDLLVLDPPRDGAAGVVEGVMKTRPKNILYVSCNPETLARDLKFLKDFANYELVQSQPIDMFPQSYHIESLNWLRVSH